MKISRICKANEAGYSRRESEQTVRISEHNMIYCDIIGLTDERIFGIVWRNILYTMPDQLDPKRQALRDNGTFNPRADQVQHPLFRQSDFFDPQDLLQLKYETLRALEADRYSIAQAAREFGLSRPTIYQAQSQFQQQGLEGLLPHKRGPHNPHKLTAAVRNYLEELSAAEPGLSAEELSHRVRERFKIELHPRTIQKALRPKAKKGRLK
jgi:transposase